MADKRGHTRLEKKAVQTIKHNTKKPKKPKKIREKEKLKVDAFTYKCNKAAISIGPILTKDTKHVICACGRSILLIRKKTGIIENVSTKHKLDIHSLFINEKDPSQIISCSNREVLVWDYAELTILKQHRLQFEITGCVLPSLDPGYGYFKMVQNCDNRKESKKEVLIRCRLKNGLDRTEIGPISKHKKSLVIDKTQKYIAYTYKEKLSIYNIAKNISHSYVNDENHLTCVAFHPSDYTVATGNKQGKIVVWYQYHEKEATVNMQLHWHNGSLNDLLFTNDANYLMSGGREGVLVVWQLETQHKTFVPRLGGAIDHLFQSSDSQFIGVSLDCNSKKSKPQNNCQPLPVYILPAAIKLLSAVNNKLTRTIRFLAPAHEQPIGLSYHPQTDCVVLNGRTDGVLQFYQPIQDSVKLNLDVIGENLVSSVVERHVYPTRVTKIAFSSDGMWMVTVDVREDRILPVERKLKFWKYAEKDKNYVLTTVVDPPHDDTIYSLSFRPPNDTSVHTYMVATTSKDGFIKTWVACEEMTNKGATFESWQIHSIGSYGKESCKEACFSHDGSILAVLFSEITLWDPENLTLQTNLTWNLPNDTIKSMMFCNHESSQYLIGYSDNLLVIWDLKSCSIKWQMEANVKQLVTDPYSRYFAVFVWFHDGGRMHYVDFHEVKNVMRKPIEDIPLVEVEISTNLLSSFGFHIYLFDPSSPSPLGLISGIADKVDTITSAIFTPRPTKGKKIWSQAGYLYYLTKDTEVMLVKESNEIEEEATNDDSVKDVPELSSFENIFGVRPKGLEKDVEKAPDIPVGNPSSVVIRKMMSTPAHVLPSVDVMCQAFLKSLLIQNKIQESIKNEVADESEGSDIEMEDEDDNAKERIQTTEGKAAADNKSVNDVIEEEKFNFVLPTYDFDFIKNVFE